jgi:hypothetical protein
MTLEPTFESVFVFFRSHVIRRSFRLALPVCMALHAGVHTVPVYLTLGLGLGLSV